MQWGLGSAVSTMAAHFLTLFQVSACFVFQMEVGLYQPQEWWPRHHTEHNVSTHRTPASHDWTNLAGSCVAARCVVITPARITWCLWGKEVDNVGSHQQLDAPRLMSAWILHSFSLIARAWGRRKRGNKCVDSHSFVFKMLQNQAAGSKYQENPAIIRSSNHVLLEQKLKRAHNLTGPRGAWTHLFLWALKHTTPLPWGQRWTVPFHMTIILFDPNPGKISPQTCSFDSEFLLFSVECPHQGGESFWAIENMKE